MNRQQNENLKDALEDVIIQLAEGGDSAALRIADSPLLFRRVFLRVKRLHRFREIGDGKILDAFERLIEFLIEHQDEIKAIIMFIIGFLGKDNEDSH